MLLAISTICFSEKYISYVPGNSSLILAGEKGVTTIHVNSDDWIGVRRAAKDLANDIMMVTCHQPELKESKGFYQSGHNSGIAHVLIGTIGKSDIIDRLIKKGKLNVDDIRGQWESYVLQTIDGNLVIAGSDKRGTIYGIYDLSEKIGVSPWYWWADAKPEHHTNIYIKEGRYVQQSPKVKYRGIFINDEEPSMGSWSRNHFGGYNSKMYTHIFELLLRLKANYLWPAMWNARFNEDDTLNPKLADEYGIVMGTSHHEPMMRAHKEYVMRKNSIGHWDYKMNKQRLDKFFRDGIERNHQYDNLITIGMRGDGDVAMGSGDDIDNMKVLKGVIDSQQKIISDVYGRNDVPQLWAIFTEVQRYYDAGFNVPDNVTLLFCDNNWGYIRRTGPDKERNRKGGMGLYYHIDMNGGPWNDRWINTTTIPKLREQLNLAYQTGIDRIWLINVGDLKPKEVPIDFIMHYAWNPDGVQPGDERKYLNDFAASIFGKQLAESVANIIARYSKYNLWRKPEVETTDYFSVENHNEARHLIDTWNHLKSDVQKLTPEIPVQLKDAYYQLVYYPAMASAGVAQMYLYAGLNNYYAKKGISTCYADSAKALFDEDKRLTAIYNDSIADGKWKGMMSDIHIGYKQWSMPEKNELPKMLSASEYTKVNAEEVCPKVVSSIKEIAIPAKKYDRQLNTENNCWRELPDLGRASDCIGAKYITRQYCGDMTMSPCLEYDIETDNKDSIQVALGILPTQDVNPARGLRIAVSVDNEKPVMIDARRGLVDTFEEYTPEHLKNSKVLKPLPPFNRNLYLTGCAKPMRNEIFDNIRWLDASFAVNKTGNKHTVKVYMIDPEIVLERIIINPNNMTPSYFAGEI